MAGSYVLPERTLAAGAASTVDIGEVIASGQPDANGNAFPPGVTFGGYHVRKVGLHLDKTITTESLVFDRRSRTFTTFYNTCCGIAGAPTFSPDQFAGPPGPPGNFLVQGTDYCTGQTIDLTPSSTFSSDNTSIATVGAPGNVTGVATGSTNSNSFLSYFQQKTVDTCVQKNASAAEPTNVTPRILLGGCSGTDITGTTQSVVVGQQIVLCASYTLPSSGVKVNSQSWSVPGTTVGGFVVGPGSTTGGTTPTNFSQTSTTFYWVVPASSQVVVFTLNLSNGQPPTAQATFNIEGPTSLSVTICGGNVATNCQNGVLGQIVINPGPVLQFGGTPSNVGIQFTASANAPRGASNNFVWTQLISTAQSVDTLGTGNQTCTANGVPGLDKSYPYPSVPGHPNSTNDSPFTDLPSNSSETTYSFAAQMFLMWRPGLTNDIPVPLGSVSWQFFADATQNMSTQTWTVQSDSSASTSAFVQGSTYPTWSSLANGTATCH